MSKENLISQYQENYVNQFGFEAEMVKYRRKLVMERMAAIKPKVVVEVGCGSDLLYQHYLQIAGEVEAPAKLIEAAKSIMGERSVLHVNVPNATSFHRRLAKSMGLIGDVKELSGRNVKFMHYHVFDAERLRKDIEAAGLVPVEEGGYFIKPFTHAQMELVAADVGEKVLDGLFSLGEG